MRKGLIGAVVLGVIIILGLVFGAMCTERVPAGYVGIVYNVNGGIEKEPIRQGWHMMSPMQSVTLYSIGLEQSYLTSGKQGDSQHDESFKIPTSDGKTVRVDLEFSYKFKEDKITDLFTYFKGRSGVEIKNSFIKPKIIAWTQEVSAQYPVSELFGDKRTEINNKLDLYLKEKFEPYGIIIDTVNFTDISVDEETAAAIQKKVNAQQEKELAQIEAETAMIQADKDKKVAEVTAEQNKSVAKIKAEQAVIEAQAKAEAVKIEAQAQAEANFLIAKSITPNFIDYIRSKQWNGELPQFIGEGTPILNTTPSINQ